MFKNGKQIDAFVGSSKPIFKNPQLILKKYENK